MLDLAIVLDVLDIVDVSAGQYLILIGIHVGCVFLKRFLEGIAK